MRVLTLAAICALIAATLGACSDDLIDSEAINGSGNVITESRVVSGFDQVVVLGFGTLEIDVSGTESLEIEAEDNLLQYLLTEVKGTRLELSSEENVNLRPTEPVVYRITAAELSEIEILGSADVTTNGIESEAFRLTINGAGDVELTGAVTDLDVVVNGSGDLDATDLIASGAEVSINGSGSAVVNATTSLDVAIAGSGSVAYIGDPQQLATSITGAGKISKR